MNGKNLKTSPIHHRNMEWEVIFFTYTIINFFGRGFSKYKKLWIKNHCYDELTKVELIYKISIKLHELLI